MHMPVVSKLLLGLAILAMRICSCSSDLWAVCKLRSFFAATISIFSLMQVTFRTKDNSHASTTPVVKQADMLNSAAAEHDLDSISNSKIASNATSAAVCAANGQHGYNPDPDSTAEIHSTVATHSNLATSSIAAKPQKQRHLQAQKPAAADSEDPDDKDNARRAAKTGQAPDDFSHINPATGSLWTLDQLMMVLKASWLAPACRVEHAAESLPHAHFMRKRVELTWATDNLD